jgi:hypothetical protein
MEVKSIEIQSVIELHWEDKIDDGDFNIAKDYDVLSAIDKIFEEDY